MAGSLETFRRGKAGEALAALCLMLKGYRILARRYKTPVGEADLVAARGKILVFAEVKSRGDYGAAAEAITARQRRRIMRAAEYFLGSNLRYAAHDVRFDALIVLPFFRIRHVENAFGGL
ncbi:MAG TPA: YraN family protein [Sphingomonadales bacterium]|nr:YraN family protein [Sphingomonadales bacterium]